MSFEKGEVLLLTNKDNPSKIKQAVAIEDGPPGTVQDEFGDVFTVSRESKFTVSSTGFSIPAEQAEFLANGELSTALYNLGLQHSCGNKLFDSTEEIRNAYLSVLATQRSALLTAFTDPAQAGAEFLIELIKPGEKKQVARHLSGVEQELNEDNEFVCTRCGSPIADSAYAKGGRLKISGEVKEQTELLKGFFGDKL